MERVQDVGDAVCLQTGFFAGQYSQAAGSTKPVWSSAYLALELHDFLLDLDISGGRGFTGPDGQGTVEPF